MKKIRELTTQELKWLQPHALKMEYELLDGHELVATLRFRSSFRSLATGESADGCWTLKREGAFHQHVVIRACDSTQEVAVFRKSLWKCSGTLELPGGRTFRAHSNVWNTRYTVTSSSEEPVIEMKNYGFFRRAATVRITHRADGVAEIPFLVMLAFYLDVLEQKDAALVAAVGAGASG